MEDYVNYADVLYGICKQYCFETLVFVLLLAAITFLSITCSIIHYKNKISPKQIVKNNNHAKKRKHNKQIQSFDRAKEKSRCVAQCILFLIVFIILLVIIACQMFVMVKDMIKDIDNNSFYTYQGEFLIKSEPHQRYFAKRHTMVVLSENYSKMPYERNNYYDCIFRNGSLFEDKDFKDHVKRGKYSGTLVYGINSKTIVYCDIEPRT